MSPPPQTPFPSSGKNKTGITLDAAREVFLTDDELLISLKGGELYAMTKLLPFWRCALKLCIVLNRYLFHLLADGRTVNDIQLTKVGSSVITTCVRLLRLLAMQCHNPAT